MYQIAFITDAHIDESFPKSLGVNARANWKKILDDLKIRKITEIVFGGDMGEPETNQWLFESMEDFKISVSLGNHDVYDRVIQYFNHSCLVSNKELNYSFDENGFKRIYLDSSAELISDDQCLWLKKELMTELPVMLFVHHAIFPINTAMDRKHYLKGRDRIQRLLTNSNNRVYIFCGHYHMADEQQIGKITQYISPAVSYQVIKEANPIESIGDSFGYRIIRFRGLEIETEIIRFEV